LTGGRSDQGDPKKKTTFEGNKRSWKEGKGIPTLPAIKTRGARTPQKKRKELRPGKA